MQTESTPPSRQAAAMRWIAADALLATHLVLFAAVVLLAPHGFPVRHARFWLHTVLPITGCVLTAIGLIQCLRHRATLPYGVLLAMAAGWLAVGITLRIAFPVSLATVWWFFPGIALVCGMAAWLLRGVFDHRSAAFARHARIAVIACGGSIGSFAGYALVPEVPTTRPIVADLADGAVHRTSNGASSVRSTVVPVGDNCRVYPAVGEVTVDVHHLHIRCAPLLTFDRTSADGAWSLLAPAAKPRRLVEVSTASWPYAFRYGDRSAMQLSEPDDAGTIRLTSTTAVERDTYSHLNTFCHLQINGHTRLGIVFGRSRPSATIRVEYADYPDGRPMRFAAWYRDGVLRVLEARSGEKGPYRELDRIRLAGDESLVMTLCDESRPIAEIELKDFTVQASTALSPAAGWGLPVNAIEFSLSEPQLDSRASIWMTLAGTSVGRGWDCVGHTRGNYQNRVEIRPVP